MAKLKIVITILVSLAILHQINCQAAKKICPRFLCEAWTPLQNINSPNQIPTSILNSVLSQFRTGLNPNSQTCFQQNFTTNSSQQGTTIQYFMHTCPYPNYFCGITLAPPTQNGAAAINQTTAQCQLLNQTNLLNVGDWCYSNSDCWSGLCDNRNQGASNSSYGYSSNTAWANNLSLNVQWSNPFQQGQYFAQQNQFNTMMSQSPFFATSGTNKCFVRKYNESCQNHQQCGLGLRCATNPWQSSQSNEPQYVCLYQLNLGASCGLAGNFSQSTTNSINQKSWELCPYGTACARLVNSSPGSDVYTCLQKFKIQDTYQFQFVTGYFAYQPYYLNMINFQLPSNPSNPVGNAQPWEMCSSNVTDITTISTSSQQTYTCLAAFASQNWQTLPCQKPTDCACINKQTCNNYPYLKQSCTCSIWNSNGSAYCKGFLGNKGGQSGQTYWSNFISQYNQAITNYTSMTTNPPCYNYMLFDQMPYLTTFLFRNAAPQCQINGLIFENPSPNALRPGCLEGIFHNPIFVAPQAPWELDMMEQFYGNGSTVYNNTKINPNVEGQRVALIGWIPYSPLQQNVPGASGTININAGVPFDPSISTNWNPGTCPQFICQNITTTQVPVNAQGLTFSSLANYYPILRGACMLYDPNLNQWSMRVCKSTLDVCVPCLPDKCQGYANYSLNQTKQNKQINLGSFAYKCLRADGTQKRVFEDCWDDSDCLSGFCQLPGYCAVRTVGQTCFSDNNCDRNLRCVYNPTLDIQSTCQPAIAANGYCDQNSWQQCKFGSYCLLVTGEFYPRCVNMYSLPGQSTFQFIGIDLGTIQPANYSAMCSSGYYQTNPLNAPTYVNYTGCLITPPKTYGGWPKQCYEDTDCNSITLVQLIGQAVNFLNSSTNSYNNSQCVCDNPQSAPFWMGNVQGQMFCQGFDGERNNLQKVSRQSYERDFQNCYPYEVLNANLSQLGYLGGFCGSQIINWYDPAPNRPIGSCYNQWMQDLDITNTQAFKTWAQSKGYSPVNSFLYNLFQRCPVYTCQNSSIQAPGVQSKNSICRYFNVTTNQIQLFGCPAGQTCNQFNSTFWLCGWDPSLQKNLTQTCTFDVECVSQYCNPTTSKCDTLALGQSCYDPNQCGKGLICTTNSSLYQGAQTQVLLNLTNTGTQCLQPGPVNAICFIPSQINNKTLCPYGTKCILTSLAPTDTWKCVPFYSLGPSSLNYTKYVNASNNQLFLSNINAGPSDIVNILQPAMSQDDLNMMCQTGFYFQDPTQPSTNNFNTQQMGYCAFNKLWNSTSGKAAYKQQCMSNQDCINNFYYTIAQNPTIQQQLQSNQQLQPNQYYYNGNFLTNIQTYGNCNCSFINDQGSGWCHPQPSDYQELPGFTQFYSQGFQNCYPFEYLTGLNIQSTSCNINTFGIQQSVFADYSPGLATQTAYTTCITQIFPNFSLNSGINMQILPQFGYQYPTNFTTFCPAYKCLTGTFNPYSICVQYTSTNVLTFQKCTNSWDSCQFYNSTLALCQNQTVQKNQGDNCMFNWQCRSNMCSNNGTCVVASVNQSCVFHYNCDKNSRCSIPSVLNANIYLGKQCVPAIPNGGNCNPWSFDQCKMGSSCLLQQGQTQPVCTNWYSLQGGAIFSLITNYSIYNNSQYHASMQSTFNQMCASGLYDPIQGCKALPEVTQGGWPKACQQDSDCNGARYGTPGVCSCDNVNAQGTGYCVGFLDEMNNMTSTLAKNFQRPFTTCYPYEINTYFLTSGSAYTDCGRYDYGVWPSAPSSAFATCYPNVGLPYYTGAPSLVTVNFILALILLVLMLFK